MTPIEKLEANTTDYTIHCRDFARHGFRYEVTAVYFFAYSRCVGHTLDQAVDRALASMRRADNKQREEHGVTWEDAEELLGQGEADEDRN